MSNKAPVYTEEWQLVKLSVADRTLARNSVDHMPNSGPGNKRLAIIGSEPEALLLAVLFAESRVSSFLVGSYEPLNQRRPTRNALDEARWLLGIHSQSGTISLLENIEELPFSKAHNIILTRHCSSLEDSSVQERTIRIVSKNILKGSAFVFTGLSKPGQATVIADTLQRHGGLRVGSDLGFCYLPLLWNGEDLKEFRETPRIIAGSDHSLQDVQELFLSVFPSITSTRRVKAAEAAGLFAPVYRDVVGALEHELAHICVEEGVDYTDALGLCHGLGLSNLGSPRPFPSRDSVGSEIAISLAAAGTGQRLIQAARRVNEELNKQIVSMVKSALARCGHGLRHSRIAVLGLDGLGINNKLRPEPIGLLQTLKRRGASISVYPGICSTWVDDSTLGGDIRVERNMVRAVEKAHCALVALNRAENGELSPEALASEMSHPAAICDLTGVLEASNVERAGLFYTSIGRGDPEA